jgi:flagellar basal body rod protein FlgC
MLGSGTIASGILSAELRLRASVHNLANATTPGFRPLRIQQASAAAGGSHAWVHRAAAPEPVDLVRERVEQIRASLQFKTSLRVFSIAAELRGRLFDSFG